MTCILSQAPAGCKNHHGPDLRQSRVVRQADAAVVRPGALRDVWRPRSQTTSGGRRQGQEIAEGIGAVVPEMRTDFPQAKILLLAIFPRGLPGDSVRDKITDINKIIAKLDDQRHVFYLDIGPKFLDERGAFLPDAFRPDNLHPRAKGYDIWGAAVKDKLAELMK